MYWMSFDTTGNYNLSHEVLSWPTTLLVVRSFAVLPQRAELDVFLEELFEAWYTNKTLRRAFKAFARYLHFRFSDIAGSLPADMQFDFSSAYEFPPEEYSDLGHYDLMDVEHHRVLTDFGVFQNKHPLEPGCYFTDLPRKPLPK